ncbi:aldehyde dehydrogenase family protein [Bacillus thuringiensis]|nr:aldehyde dehydrogenase family protein [Bacillus thuringiensis]
MSNIFSEYAKQFIDGEWREGKSQNSYTNRNPYDQSELVSIKLATVEDVEQAYRSAKAAQKEWAKTNAYVRSGIIHNIAEVVEKNRELLVNILVSETGSTFTKANAEVDFVVGDIKEYASLPLRMKGEILPSFIPGKENRVYHLPVGVVGVISPFNFPLYLSIRAIIPALATGNGVVVKPDLQTYISGGLVIAKLLEEVGLPKGLFNVVVADIAEIGDAMIENPIPKVISFTGSSAAGRRIGEICGRNLKKASLELGGNNVMIVLEDADVEQAASAAVFGKFLHQGQVCMALNRIIVHRKIYDQFIDAFAKKASVIQAGNPADPNTFVGPLINERQVDKIQGLVDQAIAEGARVIKRGKVKGTLMEPVILADVTNDMATAKNEVFGPVANILPVDSEEEAIRIANETDFGLSGSLFTRDLEHGVEVALQIETGMMHINDQSINTEPNVPFGGEKSSGLGRHGSDWSLHEFTSPRWVSVQKETRPFPF